MAWTKKASFDEGGTQTVYWEGDDGSISWTDPEMTQAQKYAAAPAQGMEFKADPMGGGGGMWENRPNSALAEQMMNNLGGLEGNAYGGLTGINDLAKVIEQYAPGYQFDASGEKAMQDYSANKNANGGWSTSDFGVGYEDLGPKLAGPQRLFEQVSGATNDPALMNAYAAYRGTPEGVASAAKGMEMADYKQPSGTLADNAGLLIPLGAAGLMGAFGGGLLGGMGASGGESFIGSGLVDGLGAAAYEGAGAAGMGAGAAGAAVDPLNFTPAMEFGAGPAQTGGLTNIVAPNLSMTQAAAPVVNAVTSGTGLLDAAAKTPTSLTDKIKKMIDEDPMGAAKIGLTAAGLAATLAKTTGSSDDEYKPSPIDQNIVNKYGSINTTPGQGVGGMPNYQGFQTIGAPTGLLATRLDKIKRGLL